MIFRKQLTILFLSLFIGLLPAAAAEIHDAARNGDLTRVKEILAKNPGSVNALDDRGCTPLYFAAYRGHKAVVELLTAGGAKIDAKEDSGTTPLHWAAASGRKDMVELLISKGAKVNEKDERGYTALFFALNNNRKEVLDLLISKGLDVNGKDRNGRAPLHHAAVEGLKDITELLIAKGAHTQIRDNDGHTPLHLAAYYGQKEVAELLITGKTGVNINIKSDGGDTPLHGAAWGGHIDTVELLLANGAKVTIKNNLGKTPLDNAAKLGRKDVAKRLIAKEATLSTNKNKNNHLTNEPALKNVDIGQKKPIKMTIFYDNYVYTEGTKSAWGFSCLIEGMEKTILFDTGAKPEVLMHNVNQLKVDLKKVDQVVISHDHWDHTGGLFTVLEKKTNIPVYLPYSFPYDFVRKVEKAKATVVPVNKPVEICKNVFLTGEMGDQIKEQSMILNTAHGLVVVTGCSHQGIVNIVKKAKEILNKDVYLVFGGFHLMGHSEEQVKSIIREFKQLGVKKCGPTHCTGDKPIQMFKEAYGDNYVKIGTGRVLEVPIK